ncbi:DUF4235 domain-containing protein [Actinomadura scrupuli]|uniref:DUF4235 domain-containing protein n=1 Tax=Actinomadura scrupuli TaxID=559629 RepID=UPI003D99D3A2
MNKAVYKPMSMGFSLLGGMLAGAVFKQTWKLVSGDDEAPDATDQDHSWAAVLTAAALQGAVFGLVRAAVQRAGAQATGQWSDD